MNTSIGLIFFCSPPGLLEYSLCLGFLGTMVLGAGAWSLLLGGQNEIGDKMIGICVMLTLAKLPTYSTYSRHLYAKLNTL